MVDPKMDKPHAEALAALEERLKSARTSKGGRDAVSAALRAVVEFINAIPALADQSLALPLVQLTSALEDLNNGRVVAMLAPTRFENRQPDSGMRKVQRAYAIFAVDELNRFGMKIEAACRLVADVLTEAGVTIGGQRNTPDWKTIRGWRQDGSRRRSDDLQASVLAALQDEGRLADGMSLAEVQKTLRSLLVPRLRELGKGLE